MYKKILVPVDGSEVSNLGLEEAFKLATSLGSTLRFIHVIGDFASRNDEITSYMDDPSKRREEGMRIIKEVEERAKIRRIQSDSIIVESDGERAANEIIRAAKDWGAELIVLGTHGRRRMSRLLMGSDAEEVVRQSSVPVLLVRAPKPKEGGTS